MDELIAFLAALAFFAAGWFAHRFVVMFRQARREAEGDRHG